MRHQDAVGTVKAQAVGAGQQKGIFKQLQADRAGQLRLQCFHLQLNQSKGDIKSHGSWPVTCMEQKTYITVGIETQTNEVSNKKGVFVIGLGIT